MGFTITEELVFPAYGISQAGCYVTLKGTGFIVKRGTMIPLVNFGAFENPSSTGNYTLFGTYYVYGSKEGITPLQTGQLAIPLENPSTDVIGDLYTNLKLKYTGKTITDDL